MLKKQPQSQLSAPNSKYPKKLFGVDSVTFGVFSHLWLYFGIIEGTILVLAVARDVKSAKYEKAET